MTKGLLTVACCLLLVVAGALPLSAQLAAPTSAGVSLGAVYYTVPDVAAHKKIWVDIFGAKPTMVGKTEMLKIPGVFIVLNQGTPATGTPLAAASSAATDAASCRDACTARCDRRYIGTTTS